MDQLADWKDSQFRQGIGDIFKLQRSSVDRALGSRLGKSGVGGATDFLPATTRDTRTQAHRQVLVSPPLWDRLWDETPCGSVFVVK